MARFRKEALPPARLGYEREGLKLSPARNGRALALCPFHNDKNPSLSVNLTTGRFCCFSCGAHGDMIDYVRLRDGCDFRTAAKQLGAWREELLTSQEQRDLDRHRREQEAEQAARRELVEAEKLLRIHYREQIQRLESLQRETLARRVDPQAPFEDKDRCWHLAALLQDELRECVTGYYLLSFGLAAEREEFIRNPDWRNRALAGTLDRGYVRDDEGHTMEIDF